MAKYIDSTGLSYLMTKLKAAFAPKSHTHPIDEALDSTSENPVQNKAVEAALTDGTKLIDVKGLRTDASGYAHAKSWLQVHGTSDIATYSGVWVNSSGWLYSRPKASFIEDVAAGIDIPAASSANPAMDGTAAAGSSANYARADHVHPTDTSRAAASHSHAIGDLPTGTSATTVALGNHTHSGYAASTHAHGSITSDGDITATAPTIASGDKLIINDESASKVTNGPSFGTSTSTYLRNDGTWGTPTGTIYNDFTGATASAAGSHGLVPAPASGQTDRYLRSNGVWSDAADVVAASLRLATPGYVYWDSESGLYTDDAATVRDEIGAQATLVSGTNIKTIGNQSLLGSGNLTPANIGAQATLVSGTNIKTVNGESLLGSGNITISGGSGNYLPKVDPIVGHNEYGSASLFFDDNMFSGVGEYGGGSNDRVLNMSIAHNGTDTGDVIAEVSAADYNSEPYTLASVRAKASGDVLVEATGGFGVGADEVEISGTTSAEVSAPTVTLDADNYVISNPSAFLSALGLSSASGVSF